MAIVKSTPKPSYGRYFLYEAPGDEATATVTTANAAPTGPDTGGGDDVVDDTDDPLDTPPPAPDNDTGVSEDPGDGGGGNTPAPDTPTDANAPAPNAAPTGPDTGGGDDNVDNTSGDDAATDGGPDTGDDTDPVDGNDDMGGDDYGGGDDGMNDTADNGQNDDDASPVDYNSTRKYMLSKEFINLYNSVDNYVEKLSGVIIDNPDADKIIKKCTKSLNEIKELLFDYLTIKYNLESHVKNLLFYQKMIVSIKLIFDLLRDAYSSISDENGNHPDIPKVFNDNERKKKENDSSLEKSKKDNKKVDLNKKQSIKNNSKSKSK